MTTTAEVNEYMQTNMKFIPRMYQVINQVAPDGGMAFANFYQSIFADGAIPKKLKELMFVAIGVSHMSPRCLIHVVPAIEAGATDAEIFEAVNVGVIGAGFVPNGPGIPYAFEYAVKVLDIAAKHRKGEKWEYLPPPQFDNGVY
jgi:alkylhydroperoxidase/carboxymuconolactone decarboxylase family protein YurZ